MGNMLYSTCGKANGNISHTSYITLALIPADVIFVPEQVLKEENRDESPVI